MRGGQNRTGRSLACRAKRILRGRRGQQGETLTEVLVAIVISGLALLMLAMVISTSANITMKSRQSMDAFYRNSNELAAYAATEGGSVSEDSAVISVSANGTALALADGSAVSIPVSVYTSGADTDAPVVSYERQVSTSDEGGA